MVHAKTPRRKEDAQTRTVDDRGTKDAKESASGTSGYPSHRAYSLGVFAPWRETSGHRPRYSGRRLWPILGGWGIDTPWFRDDNRLCQAAAEGFGCTPRSGCDHKRPARGRTMPQEPPGVACPPEIELLESAPGFPAPISVISPLLFTRSGIRRCVWWCFFG